MSDVETKRLIDECRQIEEDSKYTAEAHYLIGAKRGRRVLWLKFVPPGITVFAALILVSGHAPDWVAWITALGAIVTITNMISEPERESRDHFAAAKEFTALKQEARSLHEAFSVFIDEKNFFCDVRRLRDKYNLFAKLTPPTDDEESWQQAVANIREGRHRADFREGK